MNENPNFVFHVQDSVHDLGNDLGTGYHVYYLACSDDDFREVYFCFQMVDYRKPLVASAVPKLPIPEMDFRVRLFQEFQE